MQAAPSLLANASPSGARRPAITILAPSATKTSAVRSPMPLVAPVITATLPSSRPMSFSWFDAGFEYIPGLPEQRKPGLPCHDRRGEPKCVLCPSLCDLRPPIVPWLDLILDS